MTYIKEDYNNNANLIFTYYFLFLSTIIYFVFHIEKVSISNHDNTNINEHTDKYSESGSESCSESGSESGSETDISSFEEEWNETLEDVSYNRNELLTSPEITEYEIELNE